MSLVLSSEKNDLPKLAIAFEKLKGDIEVGKNSALGSTGYFLSESYKSYMRSEGEGTWPKPHPLTLGFRKPAIRGFGTVPLKPQSQRKSALSRFSKFVRYIRKGNTVATGLSFDTRAFNANLEAIANELTQGYKVPVTPKMRRFLAIYGYPLRNSTLFLTIPSRSLEKVQQNVSPEIYQVFLRKFVKTLGERSEIFGK